MLNKKPTKDGWYVLKVIPNSSLSIPIYFLDVYVDGLWLYCDNFGVKIIDIIHGFPYGTSYIDMSKEVKNLNNNNKKNNKQCIEK